MDLKELQAIGAIVPRTLFKREIEFEYPERKPQSEWADPGIPELVDPIEKPRSEWEDPDVPETFQPTVRGSMTTFIRRGSSADAIEIANASARERPFVAIFRSVCTEDGKPVFPTLEEAMQLATWIVLPLFNAINSISGDRPKPSPPGTNSGASSRSRSAGARSRNGRKQSRSTRKPSGASIETSAAP
jgi:hypothetical protein